MIGDEHRDAAIARSDPIIGFADRGALEMAAPVAIASAIRAGLPVSVGVIALDDADDALARDRSVSLALRASVRATDQLFRLDEDRIVVLMPMTAGRGVSKVMLRVARLCDRPFAWGAATAPTDGTEINELLGRACSQERTEYLSF
jgi:GGDEF domain-containing protein